MTALLLPNGKQQYFTTAGLPAVGYKVATFDAGTSNPRTTWSDALKVGANANPVILDARGEASIFWDGTYKVQLQDSTGAIIWTQDNLQSQPNSFSASLVPAVTNTVDLGSVTLSWRNVYVGPNNAPILDTASGNVGYYRRTTAETAAAVTPTSYSYPPGNVLRYGAVGDGVTDDTGAITNALLVVNSGITGPIVFPAGYTFKITSYIRIYSNTTIHLFGTLQLTNRASGLFANGASNICIYGFKIGQVTDTSVVAAYDWNHQSGGNTVIAPAIHIRSCNNVLIDGVTMTYVCQGIQLSNATTNTAVGASWVLSQAQPKDNVVSNCNMQNIELGGITGYQMLNSAYRDNYVGRCGDGGMWMMGASRVEVTGNHRVGPIGTPAAVNFGAGPFNILATPNTWNDFQGLQFEACVDLLIEGNIVENMWAQGIDIKNNSMRVLCQGNIVKGCENASIAVREGDAVKNPCHKVTIRNNVISNHGTLLFNTQNPVSGAIRVGECYIAEVTDNTIYSYQNTPGISCLGPSVGANLGGLTWLQSQYGGNPHQAAITVSGNTFDFKSVSQEQDPTEFQFMGNPPAWTATTAFTVGQTVKPTAPAGYYFVCAVAGNTGGVQPTWPTALNATVGDGSITWICQTTPSAILVSGLYDSVLIDANHIRTDRYLLTDARFNLNAAISVTYINAISTYYPVACTINNNVVEGWGTHGINVAGLFAMTYSGLVCNSNALSACAGSGIVLTYTHKAVCNGNTITQPGTGAGSPGIQLNGTAGNVLDGVSCCGNAITGGFAAGVGGNAMTFGISTNFAANMKLLGNTIAGAATASVATNNISGNHDWTGTSGFWRSAAGSPNGSVVGYALGEMYFDTTASKWWACSGFGTTTWTQLSN